MNDNFEGAEDQFFDALEGARQEEFRNLLAYMEQQATKIVASHKDYVVLKLFHKYCDGRDFYPFTMEREWVGNLHTILVASLTGLLVYLSTQTRRDEVEGYLKAYTRETE